MKSEIAVSLSKWKRIMAMVYIDRGKTFSIAKLVTESCFDRPNDLASGKANSKFHNVCFDARSGKFEFMTASATIGYNINASASL